MTTTHHVGDRVRVAIPDGKRPEWARGAVDALNGAVGAIVERGRDPQGGERYLVAFDKAAATWWARQSPPRSAWFDADEISPE